MGILTCLFGLLDKAMNLSETMFFTFELAWATRQALASDPDVPGTSGAVQLS